jgi:hypothetical protein
MTIQLANLKRLSHQRTHVRFKHRYEKSSPRGYILDIGPEFFLLAVVNDRIWLDGFECFRIRDISKLIPDPYADFAQAAMKKRGERISKKPRVSLKNVEELLLSANRAFPLVTIQRQKVDPDICWIGRVLGVDSGYVSLLEINPDASWDREPSQFRLSEITSVSFGADYEDALHLVGGNSPPSSSVAGETSP